MSIQKIGKYFLLEKVASGGMAEIYLSMGFGAENLKKFFAIKKIHSNYSENKVFIEMFKEEARIASQLNHANLLPVYDFGVDKINEFFIVMEYVNGKNLRQILQSLSYTKEKLPIEFILYIIKEVASGLDYAHQAKNITDGTNLNIIHRDVSPQNIMISFDGDIKIIDFGIAKSDSQKENTKAGTLKGKYAYMSPEQVSLDPLTFQTDLYSLGIILWELLSSKRLFYRDNEIETITLIKNNQVPKIETINSNLPQEICDLVNKMLERDPKQRFQNGNEISNQLNIFLNKNYPEFSKYKLSQYLKHHFQTDSEMGRKKLIYYSQLPIDYESELSNIPVFDESSGENTTSKVGQKANTTQSNTKTSSLIISQIDSIATTEKASHKVNLIYSIIFFALIAAGYFVYSKNKSILETSKTTRIIKTEKVISAAEATNLKDYKLDLLNVERIYSYGSQACFKTKEDKFYCWGDNKYKQLGVNTNISAVDLQQIESYPKWEKMSFSNYHSCGIVDVQKERIFKVLKCWGDNSYGQVGDPSQTLVSTPTTIDMTNEYIDLSTGLYHTCGIIKNGLIRCWGRGDTLQLGHQRISLAKIPVTFDNKIQFKKISSGAYHNCALKLDNTIKCWGRNDFGQLGSGDVTYQGNIVDVDNTTKYFDLSLGDYHSCAIGFDYKLRCWGKNDFGQLGTSDNEPSSTPRIINIAGAFRKVVSGKFHTCAISTENDLWCWGRNNYFQISNDELDQVKQPTKVAKVDNNSDILIGEFSTCYSKNSIIHCRGQSNSQRARVPSNSK